jgi:dCMP deaminase
MEMEPLFKWDKRFLKLAEHVATWSKDPSTKVGAVIIRPDNTVASVGYNGFPRHIWDDETDYQDRETKLLKIIHAEVNAILNAKEPLKGYTLYTYPLPFVCVDCAKHIIQAGITTVVVPQVEIPKRWEFQAEVALDMLLQAIIEFHRIEV